MNELPVKLNDLHIGTLSIKGKDEVYKSADEMLKVSYA